MEQDRRREKPLEHFPVENTPAKGQERRRDHRVKADQTYFIGCKSGGPDVSFSGPNLAVKLLDLSARGARFTCRSRLKQGQRVQILIVRPGAGTRSSVDATVRWAESLKAQNQVDHVAAVEFDRAVPGLGLPEGIVRPKKHDSAPVVDPQRHHRRFKPERTTVHLIPRDGLLRKLGLKPNTGVRLVDLSSGGAQVVSTRKFEKGQVVDLKILLADGTTAIDTEGIVRWCRRDTLSLKARWNIGLRFGALDVASKRGILEIQQLHPR